jgi:hypothetical protein
MWSTKNETMPCGVRNRIELVLAYAVQREYRRGRAEPGAVARQSGHAPYPAALQGGNNRRALRSCGRLMTCTPSCERLKVAAGTGARALEFAILTASRTGAVRAATWDQIDLATAGVEQCPAEIMKSEPAAPGASVAACRRAAAGPASL